MAIKLCCTCSMSPVEMGRSGHGPAACAGFAGAAGSGTVSGAAGGRRFRRCGGFDPGRRFGNPRRGGGLLRRRIGNDPDRAARPVLGVFDGFARSFGSRHELFQLGGQRFQRRADLVGGLAGFVRQLFHFGGDDGESFAGIARARRFDRGIQRQQIGLFRDCLATPATALMSSSKSSVPASRSSIASKALSKLSWLSAGAAFALLMVAISVEARRERARMPELYRRQV